MLELFLRRMKKDQKGFTLVELLVVVVILGILATLAVQTIGDRTAEAQYNKDKADLRTLLSALELYKIDNDGYPAVDTDEEGEGLDVLVNDYLRVLPDIPDGGYELDDGEIITLEVGDATLENLNTPYDEL